MTAPAWPFQPESEPWDCAGMYSPVVGTGVPAVLLKRSKSAMVFLLEVDHG
jgi:hypothetical protein